ncbi:acetyl-CoA hydrolase/transferase family protein [Flammeovirgaceae bacterium SG7u.111]|nr:acetyl-CoA hydrolase/transferase family protein [Flammeovirgaceae bacterium SG7u.132]WPO33975.1 acetyl-CoA hydrolase/transferase family protein [Flammeovirgaceae bacterium SG7u.111]
MSYRFMSAEEAATFVRNEDNVAFSGFTPAGSPKAVPTAIAQRAKAEHDAGRPFKIGVFTGASTGDSLDGELARAEAIKFRTPYQSNPDLNKLLNAGKTEYFDMHLSQVAQEMRYKFLGDVDVAIIEAADISSRGEIVLTSGVGISPTAARLADRIIIELNRNHPADIKGLHDVYELQDPPYRRAVPIFTVKDLCGTPTLKVDPRKIVGVVETNRPDEIGAFSAVDATTKKIGENVANFLASQIKNETIPLEFLPIQSGVGNIANAVLGSLGENMDIPPFTMYTEVIQDSVIDLMRNGNVTFASGCSLTVTPDKLQDIYHDLYFFKPRLVLRPQELSNNPEVVRRLGLITINTALEADIFGNVNSTHVLGTRMMNGLGGSGDFTRNSFLSIFTCPSTAKGGAISTLVPMVSHFDHSEHSVKVLVTEQGVADLRGLSPNQRAETIIENCAHPDYKEMLHDYVKLSDKKAHTPHSLKSAFKMHCEFADTKDMRNTDWSKCL